MDVMIRLIPVRAVWRLTEEQIKLLIVDDDMKYCRLIKEYLAGFGYDVTAVHNGKEGLERAFDQGWTALILDLMLPGIDGLAILKELRTKSNLPVLMLTSLGSEPDRIIGLELGADDYLAKTSSPRELLARLRALIRRSQYSQPSQETVQNKTLTVGPLFIDTDARQAYLNEEPLILTPVEYDLLLVLVISRGRVKSREELLNEIRDRNYDVYDRSIDVHISALRKKLGDNPRSPEFIRTVRGSGYMLSHKKSADN